ncbi:hypothetical protein DSO57_1016072 [Entomophthora muscae]|uniref:Uncharacterized protein n=1 Tax=Entomophthora muscae TaxID=34485 RepID=A0ACC2RJQ2_9FUNG|nr:hypothetical protein DSO57_1016072 [Entomophthora muscae]
MLDCLSTTSRFGRFQIWAAVPPPFGVGEIAFLGFPFWQACAGQPPGQLRGPQTGSLAFHSSFPNKGELLPFFVLFVILQCAQNNFLNASVVRNIPNNITLTGVMNTIIPAAGPWSWVGKSASYLLKLAPLLWWALPAKTPAQVTPKNGRPATQD